MIFLYVSFWFKKDIKKPLLIWFYGYTTLFLITDYLEMITLSTALLTFAPITAIILVLIHKETLQKNFIALHTVRATTNNHAHWIEELLQATLIASNKTIGTTCLIEKNDSMLGFTDKISKPLNAPISKELITLITTSPLYQEHQLMIINKEGKLLTINDTWKKNSIDLWLTQDAQEQEQWIQDGIFFTTKTDAFLFKHDPLTRTYSTIHEGAVTTHVTAQELLKKLQHHVSIIITPRNVAGVYYGPLSSRASSEQSLS